MPIKPAVFHVFRGLQSSSVNDVLRAILDDPDDDVPRLVYADVLQRAGDPRGELIALQLAGRPEADALLAAHRAAWVGRLPNVVDAHFERGFVSAVQLRVPSDLAALELEPIRAVVMIRDDDDDGELDALAVARTFAADPRTARLRSLDLTHLALGEAALGVLLAADLRGLRELHLGDADCQTYAARAIATLPLATLGCHGDYAADLDEGIELLATSPCAASLASLVLTDCGLTARAGRAIGAAFPRLRHVSFSGGSYQANRLRDDGALGLGPHRTLARLGLVHNDVSDTFLEALAAGALPALVDLAVNSCPRVTSRGVVALARSPRFATMEALWLGGCAIDDAGVAALAGAPSALRAINLHGNPITLAGARALAASPLATQLAHLSIQLTPALEAILRPAFGDRLG